MGLVGDEWQQVPSCEEKHARGRLASCALAMLVLEKCHVRCAAVVVVPRGGNPRDATATPA